MAVVYLARQVDLDRIVAIKELRVVHGAGDPSLVQRFLREARVAGRLTHPNVVTVHDYFEHNGTPHLAMEYIERGSLRELVGHLSLAQIVGVLESVLAALDHAEQHHVVHRDVKPENLLVTSDGRIKVADFGIAKALDGLQTQNPALTAAGMTVGTPSYMAPEQAMAETLGPFTDLYSVGVMAYELLVGCVPFSDTEAPMAIIMRHINEQIPPAHIIDPSVDRELSDWIDRLLVKSTAQRTQTAAQAWDELEDIVERILGSRWRRRARLLAAPGAGPGEGLAITPAEFAETSVTPTPIPALPDPDVAAQLLARDGRPEPEAFKSFEWPEASTAGADRAVAARPEPAQPAQVDDDDDVVAAHEAGDPPSALDPTPTASAPVEEETPATEEAGAGQAALATLAPDVTESPDRSRDRGRERPSPGVPRDRSRDRPPSRPPAPAQAAASAASHRRRRGLMVAATLVVVAGAAAAAIGLSGGGESEQQSPVTSGRVLENVDLRVTLAPSWNASADAQVVGVHPRQQLGAASDQAGALVFGLVVGHADHPSLLAGDLRRALAGELPTPEEVSLGSVSAYSYGELRLRGSDAVVSVYAVPTTRGVATIACAAAPARASAMRADCRRMARSLVLKRPKPLLLGADSAYAAALTKMFAALSDAREEPERRLNDPATVSAAARRLAQAHQRAAATVAATATSPRDKLVARRLEAALRMTANAWNDVASASTTAAQRASQDYARASAGVRRGKQAILDATKALSDAGYAFTQKTAAQPA